MCHMMGTGGREAFSRRSAAGRGHGHGTTWSHRELITKYKSMSSDATGPAAAMVGFEHTADRNDPR